MLIVAVLALGILHSRPAAAAELTVTTTDDTLSGPECSLRAAILAADADATVGGCPPGDPGLDTIVLPAGVYTLDLSDAPPPVTCGQDGDEPCPPVDEDLGQTGDLDITGPVEIAGAGRAVTIVQSSAGLGGNPARVLEIRDGGAATLRDLTVRNGRPLPGEPGGGIAVGAGATLELTDCLVVDNETDGSGGGVYAGPRASVTIERCELRDNIGFGGGLSGFAANISLRTSLVTGNRATAPGGGGGLALVAGEATVERSEIADNLADDSRWGGGGILVLGGGVTVRTSTLAGNSAADTLDDGSVSDLELDETGGGGLAAFSAAVSLENSTISGNRADESRWGGGGVLSLFSDIRITHSTLRDNRAGLAVAPGGSLSALGSGDALASFTLGYSILAAASPAECGALFPPPDPAPDGTTNLVADTSCGTSIDSLGPVTNLDPLLADNGGPTRTHALEIGSNAIDAAPTPCAVALDQRGVARPQGPACDLGAVEQAAPITLTVASSGNGSGTMADTEPGGTIACTSTAGVESGDCSEATGAGTTFIVVSTPDPGSQFTGWSGCDSTSTTTLPDDTCHVALNVNRTITTAFDSATPLVTLTVAGDGSGSGTMTDTAPGGTIACTSTAGVESGNCSEATGAGAAFAVVSTPDPGSQFGGWSGCDSTSTTTVLDDTCHVTLDVSHTITATFDPITPLASTTTVSSDNNPSLLGESVTFTATVTPASPVPTGNVTFTIDGNPQASMALDGAGQASLTTASLGAGSHPVTVTYDGDLNYAPSTSGTLDQVVHTPVSITATKSVSGDFTPGGSITYTVVLTNTGTAAQPDNPGNEFIDILPPGLALVSAASTSGTTAADPGTNTVTFNGGIAGGVSVTITIDATINAQQGNIANQGSALFDADGEGTNETEVLTDDPTTDAPIDATVFPVGAQGIPHAVPTLSTLALMLLAGMLALVAMGTMRSWRF